MKIGDKVVPVKKSIGFGLDSCREWSVGKEQGYLYVVGVHSKGYILSAFKHITNGSLYGFEDVVPFNAKRGVKRGNLRGWDAIANGIRIKGIEINPEWYKEEKFKDAIDNEESLIYMSDLDDEFIMPLSLIHIKKLHSYLGKILDYCNII